MPIKQSYREKMELKKNARIASGLVSERLPGVANIVLNLTYYYRVAGPVLMTRTVNYIPSDYACFHMECMREECEDGGFDLAAVVTGLVTKRKSSVKGTITCRGKGDSLTVGHANLSYEVSIKYSKQAH